MEINVPSAAGFTKRAFNDFPVPALWKIRVIIEDRPNCFGFASEAKVLDFVRAIYPLEMRIKLIP